MRIPDLTFETEMAIALCGQAWTDAHSGRATTRRAYRARMVAPKLLEHAIAHLQARRAVCEWEELDSPTRLMRTQADILAFYKAHSVRGDARFALRGDGAHLPADLADGWRALLAAIGHGPESAAHRSTRDALRGCWRRWQAGQSYTVPEIAVVARKPKAAKARLTHCHECGRKLRRAS